jgi:hypothetical protein
MMAAAKNAQSEARADGVWMSVVTAVMSLCSTQVDRYVPKPKNFRMSSHLMRDDDTGRCGATDHSTIDP